MWQTCEPVLSNSINGAGKGARIRSALGTIVDRLGREPAIVLARVDFDPGSEGEAGGEVGINGFFGTREKLDLNDGSVVTQRRL